MVKKMDAKKLKLIVRGEKKPTFGTDPNEPWSVRAGITESEKGMLHDYLKSRGINPDFVSKDTKISHAKSHEFHKWKRDHMFDDPINYVSTTAADKMKKLRAQTEEVEIEEMKTLKLTPVEMRQKAITRAKRLTSVIKHNGLHKEEALSKKTPTVEDLAKKYNVSEEEIQKELDKGIKVEMEHTSDKKVAREIALDHLGEKMDYYKKLIKFVEEKEQLDELSPGTLSSYVLKTTSKDPKRAEPRKKAMSKLAKIMAKRPVDPKAPRYLPMGEAKTIQGTALDKFRQSAAERAKKHADIEKEMKARHASGKEDMKGAIDRLQAHLNKEEKDSESERISGRFNSDPLQRVDITRTTKHKDPKKRHSTFAFSGHPSQIFKNPADSIAHRKSEIKKSLGTHGPKSKLPEEAELNEDVFQDTQAATQTAFDMGTQADDREPVYSKKKEMSKSARMIKSLYKKNKMVKEDLYDHEKEDKSVATYGKKPKVEKLEVYDDEAQAAMVLKGGKTLTGQTRDTLEIDPIMRKANNNNNNQTDK